MDCMTLTCIRCFSSNYFFQSLADHQTLCETCSREFRPICVLEMVGRHKSRRSPTFFHGQTRPPQPVHSHQLVRAIARQIFWTNTSNGPKTFDFCPDGSPDIQQQSWPYCWTQYSTFQQVDRHRYLNSEMSRSSRRLFSLSESWKEEEDSGYKFLDDPILSSELKLPWSLGEANMPSSSPQQPPPPPPSPAVLEKKVRK